MIDFVWVFSVALSWIFVAVWMVPTIICFRRSHRNKTLVFVLSVIVSLVPSITFLAVGYIALLAFSLYRSPDIVVVQGPRGEPGPKGKDADEIPLSAAGVVKPKNSDPYKDVDPYNF